MNGRVGVHEYRESSGANERSNDDAVGSVRSDDTVAAWVIDATTPLTRLVAPAEPGTMAHDSARLLAQVLSEALERRSLQIESPQQLFPLLAAEVYDELFSDPKYPREAWQVPLAALAWVRARRRGASFELTYVCMGDCPLYVECSGLQQWFISSDEGREAALAKAWASAPRKVVIEGMKRRREQQHADPRCAIFGLARDAIEFAQSGTIQADAPVRVAMMTDGLYRLVDVYGAMSHESLAHQAFEAPSEIIRRLRSIEAQLAPGAPRLRAKAADDATLLAMSMTLEDAS
jgi:hypothetical protein